MPVNAPPYRLLSPDPAINHIHGLASAQVTITEYGDFEFASCFQAYTALKLALSHFGAQVRFVFRHFPLREVHAHAELVAEAAEAAAAQGRFWPMYELLFTHQHHLKDQHLLEYAGQLGLDLPRFNNELNDHVYLQRVQENMQSGRHLGVHSAPAFYVNGVFTDVSFGPQHLHEAIVKALNRS